MWEEIEEKNKKWESCREKEREILDKNQLGSAAPEIRILIYAQAAYSGDLEILLNSNTQPTGVEVGLWRSQTPSLAFSL